MNFSGTLIKLLLGSAIASTLAVTSAIALTIEPATKNQLISQITAALSPEQVNLRAKQITVRIDGANTGSGVIIDKSGNTYTVLSNWHVMNKPGEYLLQTIDGRQHNVEPASIKQLPGLDLAILQFESDRGYQTAEIGDSGNIIEGQNIYFAGYPGELRREDNRYYRFFAANIVGILPQSTENGYSLVYNGEAFPGMSGGPVLDRNSKLIGIHGEANIQALTGGVSNYAIPVNSYKRAIASLDTAPTTTSQPTETAATTTENTEPPEVTVDVTLADDQPPVSNPEANNEDENTLKPNEITSVPTFENSHNRDNTASENSQPAETADNPEEVTKPAETVDNSEETATTFETASNSNQDRTDIFSQPWSVQPENPQPQPQATSIVPRPQPITLISQATGIDYTSLRDLLKAKKWEEADRQTYQLIDRIIKTAKNKNQRMFIELKTIAEFSCNDIRTIDALWKKYSDNKFGFSPQQQVWQTVNQNGDFSTQTWRQFATEVGWKTGDVASSSGYLLYEQLNFDPAEAPVGHLPWWFALPEEQQNVIKHLFVQCDLNPQPRRAKPTTDNRANSNAETSEGVVDRPK
ncbi:MAG: GUN4 domain-containing protein [Pleurocapsa sp.]